MTGENGCDADSTEATAIDRRQLLTGVGVGALAWIAACGGNSDRTIGESRTVTDPVPTTRREETATGTSTRRRTETRSTTERDAETSGQGPESYGFGGYSVGIAEDVETVNPLFARSPVDTLVLERLYALGTAVDPDTRTYRPWLVVDWEVTPGAAGASPADPAVTARIRDDHEFHDGTGLTADDLALSVELLRDRGDSSAYRSSAHDAVADVRVQTPTELDLHLSRPVPSWFTDLLGTPVFPAHVWESVVPESYSPLDDGDRPVGSGAYELRDWTGGSWYVLDRAFDEYPPARAEWFPDGTPYAHAYRFDVYQSRRALSVDLLAGNVLTAYLPGGVDADTAREARRNGLRTYESTGLEHHSVSFDLRRSLFDDVAFRQCLAKAIDGEWIAREVYGGNAVPGDYLLPAGLDPFRPPDPATIAGETYRSDDDTTPVSIPDLSFPGDGGRLDADGVERIRSFLVDHPRRTREYRFGPAQTDVRTAPDGRELYVDDEPLVGAREGERGPLEVVVPETDRFPEAPTIGAAFVSTLRRIGIPATYRVDSRDQVAADTASGAFDAVVWRWRVDPDGSSLTTYASPAVDGVQDPFGPPGENFVGYDGADSLFQRERATMDPDRRRSLVRDLLARLYADVPTAVVCYPRVLEASDPETLVFTEQRVGSAVHDQFAFLRAVPCP